MQDWSVVGSRGISLGQADYTAIAFKTVGNTSVPVLAFADYAAPNSQGATVLAFTSGSWGLVGTAGFSAGKVWSCSLAIQPNSSSMWIAYTDFGNDARATVMAFDGTTWKNVGSPGFSAFWAYETNLVFQPNTSIPYLAFQDASVYSGGITVMRYTDGNWSLVGPAGFSGGQINCPSLAFAPNTSIPHIAFTDYQASFKATVMRFDDSGTWQNVTVGISSGQADDITLQFQPNSSVPYISFIDQGLSPASATVMRFTGIAWEFVGPQSVLDAAVSPNSLTMAMSPTTFLPYLAYGDRNAGKEATVLAFDGASSWNTVGRPDFTSLAAYISLAFPPNSPQPYVAYQDYDSSSGTYLATVVTLA